MMNGSKPVDVDEKYHEMLDKGVLDETKFSTKKSAVNWAVSKAVSVWKNGGELGNVRKAQKEGREAGYKEGLNNKDTNIFDSWKKVFAFFSLFLISNIIVVITVVMLVA